MNEPKFVSLVLADDVYEIKLFDAGRQPAGHGYRGPTQKRAEQDLKYWVRTKGLQQIESDSAG